jgi:hypothetical protein
LARPRDAELRERFRRHRKEAEDSNLLDSVAVPDLFDGPVGIAVAAVFVVLGLLTILVLLPLIGVALELVSSVAENPPSCPARLSEPTRLSRRARHPGV